MYWNTAYGKALIVKYISNTFPIHNGLKQGDALLPLLFNRVSDMPLVRAKQLLIGRKTDNKKSKLKKLYSSLIRRLIHKQMLRQPSTCSCHVNRTQEKVTTDRANKLFGNVVKFKYLGPTKTNQIWMQEDIKTTSNSWKRLLPFSSECLVFPSAT